MILSINNDNIKFFAYIVNSILHFNMFLCLNPANLNTKLVMLLNSGISNSQSFHSAPGNNKIHICVSVYIFKSSGVGQLLT
jgi:hypothetical protein